MKLQAVSIFVDDQQQALEFYTGVLGFQLTADVPKAHPSWPSSRADHATATSSIRSCVGSHQRSRSQTSSSGASVS